MKISNFAQLRQAAQKVGGKRLAVVQADDPVVLSAVLAAAHLNLATPILIGDPDAIKSEIERQRLHALEDLATFVEADPASAAAAGARLAAEGQADILLKGHLRTDELLRAVLDRNAGLRTGRLLSDVLLYEDTLSGFRRLVAVTDGGINVSPDLKQKAAIIENAVLVMHALGIARPKVALLSATEAVLESVPSTVDARRLTEMAAAGELGECEVFGPLALDNALLDTAARAKGISSPVAGHADIMVAPSIEAGNILGKSVKYFGGSACAHVTIGARVPVLIPSRVESTDDKLNSIALGVLIHEYLAA